VKRRRQLRGAADTFWAIGPTRQTDQSGYFGHSLYWITVKDPQGHTCRLQRRVNHVYFSAFVTIDKKSYTMATFRNSDPIPVLRPCRMADYEAEMRWLQAYDKRLDRMLEHAQYGPRRTKQEREELQARQVELDRLMEQVPSRRRRRK